MAEIKKLESAIKKSKSQIQKMEVKKARIEQMVQQHYVERVADAPH